MFDLYKYSEKEIKEIVDSMVILVDTREHEGKNEHILKYFDAKKIPYKRKKLDFGDYSFMIPKNEELNISRDLVFYNKVVIERKASLEELSGNLTKERDRLEKELALSPKTRVLIVESGSYKDLVTGNYNTQYAPKSFWATYHSFWHRYNTPILFMPDKNYTGMFIKGYFTYFLKNYLRG